MPTAVHDTVTRNDLFRSSGCREFSGTALFIDVRRSSEIVRHIEQHHGAERAADFFMRYLSGCMLAVTSQIEAKCQPSGDAVLAVIEGPDRVTRAIKAAEAAIQYIESTFEPENQELLSCNGRCRRGFHRTRRHDCQTMRFQVGAGVDDGIITESSLTSDYGSSQELVGSCVSLAAKLSGCKLSGYTQPTNAVVLTRQTYRKANRDDVKAYRWRRSVTKLSGRYRNIMIAHPYRP